MHFIYQWADALWLPLVLIFVHRHQRLWALGFVAGCMLMLRLQTELMDVIGYPHGFLAILDMRIFLRCQIVYSLFIIGFMVMAYTSPKRDKALFMAATVSLLFAAFFVSSLTLIL